MRQYKLRIKRYLLIVCQSAVTVAVEVVDKEVDVSERNVVDVVVSIRYKSKISESSMLLEDARGQ